MSSAYRVEFTGRAERDLAALDRATQARITTALRRLAADPRLRAGVKKLIGEDGYRLRVGDYRVLFERHDDRLIVLVIRIGHRREVYR